MFDVFNIDLIRGNSDQALVTPNSAVVTEAMAKKYFGDANPIGKIIRADNAYDFKITGTMQAIPRNSHIKCDIIASFATLTVPANENGDYIYGANLSEFRFFGLNPQLYTYLLLAEDYPANEFEKILPSFIDKYLGEQIRNLGIELHPYLQPLTSIHLHSKLDAEMSANSDIDYVYIFSAISLFILILACINYMNLATARSANRAKEVGLRKVVGCDRFQLIKQFLSESVFLSILAFLLALILVKLLLPVFNTLAGKNLVLAFNNSQFIFGIVGIILFVGIIAGSYPAFFLSSFKPVTVLKSSLKAGAANSALRKILVVAQFTISIIFIIGTVVVYTQLDYIQNKRLGFNKEQVVVFPMSDPPLRFEYQSFKNEILSSPDVLAVSASSSIPGGLIDIMLLQVEGQPEGENVTMEHLMVDHDFIKTLGIELTEGRDFSVEFPTDTMTAFIINETAAKQLGWQGSPLDKRIEIGNWKRGRVIGLIKDFHVKSLYQNIEPLLLHITPTADAYLHLSARISPDNIPRTIAFMESKWRQVYPNHPYEYSFLDEDFDSLYRTEELRGKIFIVFSILAIFIACLGLFGLASFTAEQRTKEIGIRKVLGASVSGLVGLLTKEFIKLVLVSNLIAWPIAYYAMNQWLQNFAYRTNLRFDSFVWAGVIALIIAILTVSYQAVKAALTNPVESLQYE